MALYRIMATGTEGVCYKCDKPMLPGQLITKKTNARVGRGESFVHWDCAPTKVKKHGKGVKKR